MSKLFLQLIFVGVLVNYSNCNVSKKPVRMPPEIVGAALIAVQKCQAETGVEVDVLLLLLDGKYREDDQFKNFIYCTYKTVGFTRSDGHINEEKAVKLFKNEPLVGEGIRRCSQKDGENPRDTLFLFFKCFIDTTPVRFTI